MRARGATAVVVVGALLAVSLVGPMAGTARADTLPPPKLYMTVWATTAGGRPVFEPSTITLGQVPTIVNLTVKNVDPTGMQHTFTIRTTTGTSDYIVDTRYLDPGQQTTVEFEVFSADRIVVGTRNVTVETSGGAIKFFCIPHEGAGMVGTIAIGGAAPPTEEPEKGVFLRAYWIGLLGIAGTLLLIGISYFVIKGSSPHFRDHHEHIRRGGP